MNDEQRFSVILDAPTYIDLGLGDLFTRTFKIEKLKLLNVSDEESEIYIMIPDMYGRAFYSRRGIELDGKDILIDYKQHLDGGKEEWFGMNDGLFDTSPVSFPIICQIRRGRNDVYNGELCCEVTGYMKNKDLEAFRKNVTNRISSPFASSFTTTIRFRR